MAEAEIIQLGSRGKAGRGSGKAPSAAARGLAPGSKSRTPRARSSTRPAADSAEAVDAVATEIIGEDTVVESAAPEPELAEEAEASATVPGDLLADDVIARRLALVLGASAALGDHLARHPDDVEELGDPALGLVRPSDAGIRVALATASDRDESIRARRDQVREWIGAPARALVDVRSPQEFSGDLLAPPGYEQEGAQRGGHIPTAESIPWAQAVRDDGTFKSADDLRSLYAAKGVTPDKEVTAYCRIGERSAHTWFVLHELLGNDDVKNYDGSWTEWGNLVDVPIEKDV